MSVIHTPRKPELDLRILVFPLGMLLLLTLLFLRLWYFQVVKAPELTERADATRQDKVLKPAPRGLIYDRNGVLIAGLRPQIVITAVYSVVQKNPDVIDRLASMLHVDSERLWSKVKDLRRSPGIAAPIYLGAPPEIGTQVAEEGNSFPGIGVDLEPMRYYPDSTSFTHILGYVRLADQDDVQRIEKHGKEPAEFVGKSGIERAYEMDLMGSPGDEIMEIDAKRRPIRVVARDNPTPGHELVLTIDAKLQQFASQLMNENHYVGALVALDPKTGEVLAMVSSPTYDQRIFEGDVSQDAMDKISKDPQFPMIKRPIQSAYQPGSTFKIVTSVAAYQAGTFDPNRVVFCNGGFRLGKKLFGCLGHHGDITFEEALEKSCNTYFADLGNRTKERAICAAAEEMGLGEKSGLDIGGEVAGVVPDSEYLKKKNLHWYGGDTINLAIGQGYIAVTPLQMADVISMVANRGVIYRPHLVKEIKDELGNESVKPIQPDVFHQVDASPEFWKELQDALEGVIESSHGTATDARIPGIMWAGKTGSAEHGRKIEGKTHSWFVGYAPFDDPKIAICAFAEDAGHGAVVAKVAREIVKRYLEPPKSATALTSSLPSASISSVAVVSPSRR